MSFRDLPLPPEQFFIRFLAPIPVGHRVQLDFHQHDVGFVGTKIELARQVPMVTDLETAIVWGTSDHFGREGFDPKVRKPTAERVIGIVRGCYVNDRTGGELDQTWTMLLVEVQSRGAP